MKCSGKTSASFTAGSSGSALLILFKGTSTSSSVSVTVTVGDSTVGTLTSSGILYSWTEDYSAYLHIYHGILSASVTSGQTIKITGAIGTPSVVILG